MNTLTMMTCRLLYALLVLALCCCPSVCATDTEHDPKNGAGGKAIKPTSPAPEPPTVKSEVMVGSKSNSDTTQVQNQAAGGGGSADSLSTSSTPAGESVTYGTKGSTDPETGRKQERDAVAGAEVLQVQPGNEESPDSRTVTAPITATTGMPPTPPNELENNSAKNVTAPTTTTTTEAPSNTTTDVPTTTTTRAPSRLREIDGSLSSSAWVCAPLLLAVSALAYTTVV
ncbi:mucin TcMUCII [Trypanosoma cruzi]|uniref:Putative mucin TcMUCII n=1 Tax=Trypanosoma cruzi TaxID=5693 RepID=A0A2V2VDH0_TRYCR|nr:mucin TcMUCII [Trypanosoma cruzi cruzi]PWU94399.1 putative mucin TcMUCII [Trypanosoma cruzi]RNF05617.1 mucin TcMUCII [Trypanosoma cruzi]